VIKYELVKLIKAFAHFDVCAPADIAQKNGHPCFGSLGKREPKRVRFCPLSGSFSDSNAAKWRPRQRVDRHLLTLYPFVGGVREDLPQGLPFYLVDYPELIN